MRVSLAALAMCGAVGAVPAYADCAADFAAVAHGNLTAGPYEAVAHVHDESEDGSGQTNDIMIVLRVVSPDRLSLHKQGLGNQPDIVVIGDKAWQRQAGGWVSNDGEAAPLLKHVRDGGFLIEGEVKELQCLGRQDHDGKAVNAYRFTARFDRDRQMTLLADPVTQLPVSLVGAPVLGKDETDPGKHTMDISFRFDPGLTVEAPK